MNVSLTQALFSTLVPYNVRIFKLTISIFFCKNSCFHLSLLFNSYSLKFFYIRKRLYSSHNNWNSDTRIDLDFIPLTLFESFCIASFRPVISCTVIKISVASIISDIYRPVAQLFNRTAKYSQLEDSSWECKTSRTNFIQTMSLIFLD